MGTFFWVGAVLGLLLIVAVGAGLGFWLGRRGHRPRQAVFWPATEARQLAQLAHALQGLVHSVAEDVDQHQTQIKQANAGLRSLTADAPLPPEQQPSAWAALVLRTVAEIVQVNERLQHRLQQAEQKLHEQSQQIQNHMAEARTDPLTGLPNRRAFDDELVRRLAEWKRKGALFCLLLVDLDHFKELNDRHGHPAGDQVLRQLAEVLLTTLREMDLAARIGGEEFAVLLPSTNLSDAMRVSQRLRAAVADAPLEIAPGQTIKLTISIGLTAVRPGDHPLLLLRRADQALYAAKQAGRDCGFYHDGQTCQPIPFCSPPDRPFPAPALGDDWTAEESPPSPAGEEQLLWPMGHSLAEDGCLLCPDAPPLCPTPAALEADTSAFQSACEALRNQLTALTDPARPAVPSPPET